jgi:hypothetical protein
MHLAIVQALIDIYSKTGSSVTDLSTSTGMCLSLKNSFSIFASKIMSNHLSPCEQHYQGLPKPWAPRPGFGVKFGGFNRSAGTFR